MTTSSAAELLNTTKGSEHTLESTNTHRYAISCRGTDGEFDKRQHVICYQLFLPLCLSQIKYY